MKELEHNLNCGKVRAVIDDMMTDDMPLSIDSHISTCRECRDHQTTNARLRELIRDSHRVTAPADFDARLRERLQNRTAKSRSFWSFIPTPALAAAATFVVTAAITFTLLKHMHSETTPTNNPAGPIASVSDVANKVDQKSPEPATSDNSSTLQTNAAVIQHTVPTTAAAYNGRSNSRNSRASVETPTNPILFSDRQSGEHLIPVPRFIVGSKSVVPRGSSGKRPQYEPSVF